MSARPRSMIAAFLTACCLVAPTRTIAAETPPALRIYRMGILSPAPVPRPGTYAGHLELVKMLRDVGYVEGQNLVVERRYAAGRLERLPALARELVEGRMDVIVGLGGAAVQAARNATTSIPIVMGTGGFDPVKRGFVATLARPGGNVTGVTLNQGYDLIGKRLELFKEVLPPTVRLAVLTTDEPGSRLQVEAAEKAAATLGLKLVAVAVVGRDYARAFATIRTENAGALYVGSSPTLSGDRHTIIALAARHRLPAVYEWSEYVEAGGLISYGTSNVEVYRRVASFVDRLFKGAKPADLPVEQPTQVELVINLGTARALGLTVPPTLLLRADRVLE